MSKSLAVYFSASGVTKALAERLSGACGADLFEIVPDPVYTDKDLNWRNPLARCNKEFFGKKDVPSLGAVDDMAQYDTLFVGFPIWYGVAPNVVHTFLKGYDLTGKKILIFATSGGSGIGKTAEKLAEYAPGAEVVKAKVFRPDASEEELKEWAEE